MVFFKKNFQYGLNVALSDIFSIGLMTIGICTDFGIEIIIIS